MTNLLGQKVKWDNPTNGTGKGVIRMVSTREASAKMPTGTVIPVIRFIFLVEVTEFTDPLMVGRFCDFAHDEVLVDND